MMSMAILLASLGPLVIACAIGWDVRRQRNLNDAAFEVALRNLEQQRVALDERKRQLEAIKASMEPVESVERYAGRLRDANEVHRYREPILRAVARAALALRAGALVADSPGHPTVHVKPADFAALVLALKPYMALHEDGADPTAADKTNALGAVGGDDSGEGDDAA